eukprot:5791990-Alexandrium_andersonii.AAC.2
MLAIARVNGCHGVEDHPTVQKFVKLLLPSMGAPTSEVGRECRIKPAIQRELVLVQVLAEGMVVQ